MADKRAALVDESDDDISGIPPSNPGRIKKPNSGKTGAALIEASADDTPAKSKKAKKKKGPPIVPISLFIIIIGALVAVVGFNVFDLRDKYLNDTLRNIPIIKNIIPPAEDEGEAEQTPEQLRAKIAELESQLVIRQEQINSAEGKLSLALDEIDRLAPFEGQQLESKAAKEAWDREIAAKDPKAYQNYFETINPDLAAELYKEAVGINVTAKELKNYVAMYSSMEPGDAGKIFDELSATELDLIALILRNMASDASGEILASMRPVNAAAVTKRMAPAVEAEAPQSE